MKKCRDFFKLIITAVICFMSGLFRGKNGQAVNDVCSSKKNRHVGQAVNSGKIIYVSFAERVDAASYHEYSPRQRQNVCRFPKNKDRLVFDTG